jgi:dimethylhistidine N-methyltransferase
MKQPLAKLENVRFEDQHPSQGDVRQELLWGLNQGQKTINPKFFYDARGSDLFDQITRLPEYYPTRTEVGILRRNRLEIAEYCGQSCIFIEPGSGNSAKVRILLETLKPGAYVPVDISAEFLHRSALQLGNEFPWLQVHAICADFSHNWNMSKALPEGKRVVFYPGSTIGNLEPAAAIAFLARLRGWMGTDGGALIGVDLHKSTSRLEAAYNDSQGVTADFNLNVLDRINGLLPAKFDRDTFSHHAFYNVGMQRVEMHLVSQAEQTVPCNGASIHFREAETIHTENSYKYSLAGFAALAVEAGLAIHRSWLDDEQLFSVHYLERA